MMHYESRPAAANAHHSPILNGAAGESNASPNNIKDGDKTENSDIQIRNVICNYSLPMHIDLRRVALKNRNVTLDRVRGVLYKQKRNPSCFVKVYSSGTVYIVGCRSEEECKRAARAVGRAVQKVMGKQDVVIRLRNYRICNMLSTYKLPFGVKIEEMAKKYSHANYEPELSVGLLWKFDKPKASLRIHTTGSITITGTTSAGAVKEAIRLIYPIVEEFRCPLRIRDLPKPTTGARRRRANTDLITPEAMISKQPRKAAPVHDPACSEFFEQNMLFQDEEEYFEEHQC